jgi:hypothetical protein
MNAGGQNIDASFIISGLNRFFSKNQILCKFSHKTREIQYLVSKSTRNEVKGGG